MTEFTTIPGSEDLPYDDEPQECGNCDAMLLAGEECASCPEEPTRCPHDGGTCHHTCAVKCFREDGGMAFTTPCEGYPLPGHEIPEAILSLENLRLIQKWNSNHGDGYSIRDRSWIHRIVGAMIEEVVADLCLTCGGRDCYCPNPHPPGGIPT